MTRNNVKVAICMPANFVSQVQAQARRDDDFGVQKVNHTYSFFDFQPIVPDTISFEPCIMLPGVGGCECLRLGCAVDQSDARAGLEQQRTNATLDDVSFNVTRNDQPCAAPPGYVGRARHNTAIAAACAPHTRLHRLKSRLLSCTYRLERFLWEAAVAVMYAFACTRHVKAAEAGATRRAQSS